MAVPAVLCSTTDVSQGNYNRIIREKNDWSIAMDHEHYKDQGFHQ